MSKCAERHVTTRSAVSEATCSKMPVKNSQQDSEVQILRDASAKIEELDLFLDVLQTRYLDTPSFCNHHTKTRCGTILVYHDPEECLCEVVHSTPG